MIVKRYQLARATTRHSGSSVRELRVARSNGQVFVGLHDEGKCISGPLKIRDEDLDQVVAALLEAAAACQAAKTAPAEPSKNAVEAIEP